MSQDKNIIIWELIAKKNSLSITKEEEVLLDRMLAEDSELKNIDNIISKVNIAYDVDEQEVEKSKDRTWNKIYDGMSQDNKKSKRVSILRYCGVAASVALLIIGIIGYFQIKDSNFIIVENHEIENKSIVLPDGSHVWLRTGAQLKYPKVFALDKREVDVDGEVYFDVVKNPNHPLIVKTNIVSIKVLGTSFNVRSSEKDQMAEVVLTSGSISLYKSGNEKESVLLNPNEKAIIARGDSQISVSETNPLLYTLWKESELSFKSQALQDIAIMIGNAYDITINIQDEKLKKEIYTGKFKRSDSLENILETIMINTPIKYYFHNDTCFIERK